MTTNPEPSDRAGLSEAIHEAIVKYAAPMTSAGRESLQETVWEIERLFADRLAVAEQERTRQRDSLSAHADELATERNQALARAEAAEQEAATLRAQVAAVDEWADRMEGEAPKPLAGGFLAEEVRQVLGDSAQVVQRLKATALEEAADCWSDWDALSAPEEWLRERARRVQDGGDHG